MGEIFGAFIEDVLNGFQIIIKEGFKLFWKFFNIFIWGFVGVFILFAVFLSHFAYPMWEKWGESLEK